MSESLHPMAFAAAKQQRLREQLQGFWEQDEWNLSHSPLTQEGQRLSTIRFSCLSPTLNLELKFAVWKKIHSGVWSMKRGSITFLADFVTWLNQVAPADCSLLSRSLMQWELSLRSYLMQQGILQEHVTTWIDGSQSPRQHLVADPHLSAFRQIYRVVQEAYDDRMEYDKDIWDLRKLNMALNGTQAGYKLNFTLIREPWLRQAIKRFLRYSLATTAAKTCLLRLTALRRFSSFLDRSHPSLQPSEMIREVLVEYIGDLTQSGLSAGSKAEYLLILRTFCELCQREGWARLPEYQLIYDEDSLRRIKRQPRFLSQEILDQLHQHMDCLDPPILRMLLILEECGMRISELCTLPYNCLVQDGGGDWFLRSYQAKMKKEHSIPVSREIVTVIQEQQQVVRQQWGSTARYLFPSRLGQPFRQVNFREALNRLAYHKQICDSSGKIHRFQAHQFRHTVATRMINNGVPLQIVQRYLGHESLEMTRLYAEIYDQTLKREYAKFRGRTVDVAGKVIEDRDEVNGLEMQWMKKHILAQALPNGYCALPTVAGPCPHANACLTCVHFRTDGTFLPLHTAHLQQTRHLIKTARINGWQRQVEMNEKVEANLERIIMALGENNDSPA